jgi:hypothetical protein
MHFEQVTFHLQINWQQAVQVAMAGKKAEPIFFP